MAKVLISQELIKAFISELINLSIFDRIDVSIVSRGREGEIQFGLEIGDSKSRGIKASQVLSEGEQRVVSLAYFFAEAKMSPYPAGLIIDDPVSSLDHRWENIIIKRLIELAKTRQVIVFTHSIWLVAAIDDIAKEKELDPLPRKHFLGKKGRLAGYNSEKYIPWEKIGLEEKIDRVRQKIAKLRKLEDDPDSTEYKELSDEIGGILRNCWELVVEKVVIYDVVGRYKTNIETQKLSQIIIDDETYNTITYRMKKLSGSSHLDSARSGRGYLNANDLEEESRLILEFKKEHLSKMKKLQKGRLKRVTIEE